MNKVFFLSHWWMLESVDEIRLFWVALLINIIQVSRSFVSTTTTEQHWMIPVTNIITCPLVHLKKQSEAKRKPVCIIVCFHHYCCNFGLIDWTDFIFYNSRIMLHKWFVSWPALILEHEWITNDDSFNSQPAAMRLFWKIALLVLIMTWYFSS